LRILFDTSVAVALREGLQPILERAEKLDSIALLSILSVVELEGGVPLAPEGAAIRRSTLDELYTTLEILEFGAREASAYRDVIQSAGFSRTKIIDRMIGAQAIVAGAAVATLNPRDFRDIPGLIIEDWSR
jgi:tRNA(fMet)-specific endonuclease VapC